MKLFPSLRNDQAKKFYEDLDEFIKKIHNSVENLSETIVSYIEENQEKAEKAGREVLKIEREADVIRRMMEKELYEGALIPFGKDSKYELIEALDDIADKAEIIVRLAKYEKPQISKNLNRDIKSLSKKIVQTSEKLVEAVNSLNVDLEKAIKSAQEVHSYREGAREIEFKIMKKLFEEKRIDINTLLLKELVTLVTQVADKAETAADRVVTLAIKYRK